MQPKPTDMQPRHAHRRAADERPRASAAKPGCFPSDLLYLEELPPPFPLPSPPPLPISVFHSGPHCNCAVQSNLPTASGKSPSRPSGPGPRE